MPATSGANLTLLRTKIHRTRPHLAVYHPTSMWTATVNGDHAAYATAITVAGAAGTTPVADYEVWFGSAAGLMDVGRSRVKSFAGVTLTIAPNNMDLAGTEFVTVKQNIIPAAIQPNCGTTILENWDVAVGTDTTTYKPLARMGPPACAFIDDTTGLATVQFWSDSEALSGALTTYLWVTPSGTYTVGNANTAGTAAIPNVVTWNAAGQYWCSLKVTDSNSKVHTTYRPVFIFNRHTGVLPYSNIEIGSMEGSQESGGWTCALTVRGTADRTAFPELAQIVIFAEDYYGDTLGSIGGDYTWRENIVFVGFIRSGSVKAHSWNQTVELQAAGIGVFMEEIPGYASNLSSGTPGGWHVLTGMTFKLGAYHMLTEHSTIDHIADVDLAPIAASADKIDFVASSLKDQVATQCIAPMRSVLGSSRLGRLYARQNPQLVAAAARTEPIVLDTANTDFRETIDITTERETKPVSQIDFNGYKFVSTEQSPVLSLAPGVPWDSGKFERVDGIYIDTQANGNIISGYFEGRANNTYPEVSLRWRGNYRVFDPFPVEKIRLNLTASQNNRGIVWTGATIKTFWVKRVSFTYRTGILLVDTSVEADVVGNPGITGNYPIVPPPPPPPEPPTPITNPPVVVPPTIPQGRGDLLYVNTLKGVAKCVGAFTNAATCTWTAVNTGLAGTALQVRAINFDPFSHNGTNFEKMWAMTDDGLYLASGLPNAVSWTQKLSIASAAAALGVAAGDCLLSWSFAPSVRTANLIMVPVLARNVAGRTGAEWVVYTFSSVDNGTTWTYDTDYYIFMDLTNTGAASYDPGMWCSFHTDNVFYMYAFGAEGNVSHENGTGGITRFLPLATVLRATVLPQFTGGFNYIQSNTAAGVYCLASPFCNSLGVPYNDDNVLIISGVWTGAPAAAGWTGINAIRKYTNAFNPAWSAGYTVPTGTSIGDAAMAGGELFVARMFNDDQIYAWSDGKLWSTQNGGVSWYYDPAFAVLGTAIHPSNMFQIPAQGAEAFVIGHRATDNLASVAKLAAWGATITDIESGANSLNTVLSIAGGDMVSSFIIVDYFKV